jgi:branched-chain amino acid transport system substrate-binding protein
VKVDNSNQLRRRSGIRASRIAVVALAAAVVTACGGDSSQSASGGSSPKEILIGFPAPLTGPGAAFGKPQADGAQMVADAINASGGIKELGGAKLKLIIKDTQSDPVIAGRHLRDMARQRVSAFVGPVTSGEVVANKPLLQNLKIPDFTGSGDATVTKDNVNGYIFRTSSITAVSAEKALDYMAHLIETGALKDMKRGAVVSVAFPPGPSVTPVLQAGLRKMGIEPTVIKYDPTQVKDFAPIVSKLRAANVDVVMGTSYPNDAVLFAQAVGRQDWRPKGGFFFSGGGWFLDSFQKSVGSVADGWVSSSFTSNLDSDTYPEQTRQLAAEFKKKYGASMEGTSATVGTTNVALIADAIAAAKSAEPEKIAAAARKLEFADPMSSAYPYYMTPGGVKFDKNQDNVALVIPFIQWVPDGFTTVYPDDIATAKLAPQSST